MDPISKAMAWAKESADLLLEKQLIYLQNLLHLMIALGTSEGLLRRVKRSDLPIEDRRISKEFVETVQHLRTWKAAACAFWTSETKQLMSHLDSHHVDKLDLVVEWTGGPRGGALGHYISEADRIQIGIFEVWKADMESLQTAIQGYCPAWSHVKETLLSEPDVLHSLCLNVVENYPKVGPAANQLRELVKHCKALMGDGHGSLVEPAWLESISNTCTHGVYTVSYTYLAWHICHEIPKLTNKVLIVDAAQSVRNKLVKAHRVKLTKQMDEYLASLESGDDFAAFKPPPGSLAFRARASQGGAQDVPPPTEMLVPPPIDTVPSVPPVAPPSDGAAAPKRRRLGERLRSF